MEIRTLDLSRPASPDIMSCRNLKLIQWFCHRAEIVCEQERQAIRRMWNNNAQSGIHTSRHEPSRHRTFRHRRLVTVNLVTVIFVTGSDIGHFVTAIFFRKI